jgi:DNA-binding transcriptional ArsR family regulator
VARRSQRALRSADGDRAAPSSGLVVRDAARDLRRSLRPVVWVVLEELALDAVAVDGELVAPTSARSIAQNLGLDPGTTASAIRALRDRGLVDLIREPRSSGRFGLSHYRLRPVPGVEVLAPRRDFPCAADSCTAKQDTGNDVAGAQRVRRRRAPSERAEQTTLDLGLGNE